MAHNAVARVESAPEKTEEELRQERIAAAQIARDEAIRQREQLRVQRNQSYDRYGDNISNFDRQGPGFKAYKFVRNFHGDDGNYYAEHISVTGRRRKVYSLSEQKEMDDRHSTKWGCNNCAHESHNGVVGTTNKCRNCGTERYIGYYG